MYAILISFALAIYSIVLVDFSFMYKEVSANDDLLTSTQAFYTAEGAIENAVSLVGDQDSTLANLAFLTENNQRENKSKEQFLDYSEGANSSYLKREMTLDSEFLNPVPGTKNINSEDFSQIRLTSAQPLDKKAYYSLEPKTAKAFVLREIQPETNFNEIHFDFNQKQEQSELVFDIFIFPKEGSKIDFQNFENLEKDPTASSIKRISINTLDSSSNALVEDIPLQADVREGNGDYKKTLTISGFQPLQNNYFLHFQTFDNKPTHFRLAAFYQTKPVILPNLMQTIDLIGATTTGLYQRVKFQREAEEGIQPGLNFAHFSEESIVK